MLLSKLLKIIYQKSTRFRGAEIGTFPLYATDTAKFSSSCNFNRKTDIYVSITNDLHVFFMTGIPKH